MRVYGGGSLALIPQLWLLANNCWPSAVYNHDESIE